MARSIAGRVEGSHPDTVSWLPPTAGTRSPRGLDERVRVVRQAARQGRGDGDGLGLLEGCRAQVDVRRVQLVGLGRQGVERRRRRRGDRRGAIGFAALGSQALGEPTLGET